MPVAVLSDIHGNLPALEAVVADAEAQGCDTFINLGDIVSGPLWPRETAEYLMARGWTTIAGNHERQVLTHDPARMGASDLHAREVLDESQLQWLESLPPTCRFSKDVFLCHGTPSDDLQLFLETVEEHSGIRAATVEEAVNRMGSRTEALILCGHSHVPRKLRLSNVQYVANPGSVGLQAYAYDFPYPHVVQNGSPDARYGIVEGREFELRQVAYDHDCSATRAEEKGQSDWAFALRTGMMTA